MFLLDALTGALTAVGAQAVSALRPKNTSIRTCRFQEAADAIVDALQHGKCSFECSSEDDGTVPGTAPALGTEQVAPTYNEEARPASRKRTCVDSTEEEQCAARESKAAKVDDIASRKDKFAEEDEEDILAHIGACCRVLDLVHKGSRPGLKSHFVCQHGGYPPGTTCDECEHEAEQRVVAAFSGGFEFGHEVNGQMAVVWTNTATGANHVDLVTISCQKRVQTSIDVFYSGDRFNLLNLAYNTTLFWSAIFLFLDSGSSGHSNLDDSLNTAYSAARDEDWGTFTRFWT